MQESNVILSRVLITNNTKKRFFSQFKVWNVRLEAGEGLRRFKKVLEKGGGSDLPDKGSEVIDESAKQHATMKRNDMAMACHTMEMTVESLLGFVYKTQDDRWPSEKEHRITEALEEQYQPRDRISRVKMRSRLNKFKMGEREKPKKSFEKLIAIENAYKSEQQQIEEEDLTADVLLQAPKAYSSMLSTEKRFQGDDLKLKHFHNDLLSVFHGEEDFERSRPRERMSIKKSCRLFCRGLCFS